MLDNYLRQRAKQNGASVHNGLFMRMEQVKDASPSPTVLLDLLSAADAKSAICPTLQQPVQMFQYRYTSMSSLCLIKLRLPRYFPVED